MTWSIALIGGDFAGTITATPGGGAGQCQIYQTFPIVFTGNGTLSKTFTFTPLDVDSVTFTFTNSRTLTNPSPTTYISIGEYLLDTFAGTSGTAIQSHTSNTLPSGLAGSTYTSPSAGAISLDGSGGTYLSAAGTAISLSNAVMPPSQHYEIRFELQHLSNVSGASAGIILFQNLGGSNFGFWYDASRNAIEWFADNSYQISGGSSAGPSAGTSWLIKIDIQLEPTNSGWTQLYCSYSADGGTTWPLINMRAPNPNIQGTSSIGPLTVGLYFAGTAITPTTGPHIANLIVQDQATAPPTCQISNAYVATSGQAVAFFFETISGHAAILPTVMNFAPTFFQNGTSIGVGTNAWVTGYHSCAILQLQQGIQINPGDTVTVSTSASWMSCGTANAANGVTKLAISNYSGMSCFGTNTLVKTLKPGFNFADVGISDQTAYGLPLNWRFRLTSAEAGSQNTVDGYPTVMHHTTEVLSFCNVIPYGGNTIDSTGYPGVAGYLAIGFDDNYQSYSGAAATTLSIVPLTSDAVVSQDLTCTSVSNTGTNGLGQVYMFRVEQSRNAATASMPIALQLINANAEPYISNLWIVGPGDFTYTPGTPLTLDRSNPYALSGQLLERLANGIGTMRLGGAMYGFSSSSSASEPWEIHQMLGPDGVSPAFSWNNSFNVNYTIRFSELRAFNPSVSPYVYSEWIGSPYNLTLNTSINATATTLSINAGNDAYAIPITGLVLLAGTEKMRIRSVTGTSNPYTVTVERGSSGTTAAVQSAGTGPNAPHQHRRAGDERQRDAPDHHGAGARPAREPRRGRVAGDIGCHRQDR